MNSPLIKNSNLLLEDKPSVFCLREKAKKALEDYGFPTRKNENWKYTDTKELIKTPFTLSQEENSCHENCHCQSSKETSVIEINFCKGKLHIKEYDTPIGLNITPLPLVLHEGDYKKNIYGSFNIEEHPFAALNGIYLEQGICIHAEKDTKINNPIIIKYNQNNCAGLQLSIHNLFILEKNTKLEILEEFSSKDTSSYFTNIVNEIYIHNDAELTHYKIQKENINSYHISLNAAKLQKNSIYNQYYLSDGAKLSRQETLVELEQKEAKAEIYSVYRAKTNCLTDITTNINHLKPETYSKQYAKAILEKESTATFQGKIHIEPNATKTSGHQLHKALYLDNNANLNCKPELEIYTDDVKCSHGASSGEIDKEQLFYLTSRGINTQDALKILTQAHVDEIISLIPNQEIKKLFFFTE